MYSFFNSREILQLARYMFFPLVKNFFAANYHAVITLLDTTNLTNRVFIYNLPSYWGDNDNYIIYIAEAS